MFLTARPPRFKGYNSDTNVRTPKESEMVENGSDLLGHSIPVRPQMGVNLFSSTGAWEQSANIDSKKINWELCDGYRKAADTIVDHFLEKRAKLNDYSSYHASLAYPIVFLYRHYLELRLKELIIGYDNLFGNSTEVHGHELPILWKKLCQRAEKASTESDSEIDEDLNTLDGVIQQFAGVDPNSLTFRYPVDKQGRVMLPPLEIDLSRLKETMRWVSFVLDGWSVGVYESLATARKESTE